MRNVIVAALVLALAPLAACNTIEGLGQDVGAVGDALSDAAEDAKD
jgi:predicted small secreted protein